MSNLKVDDFVILLNDNGEIKKNSVGIIRNIDNEILVYFIGLKIEIKTNKENISFLDVTKTGKPYDKKICNICHILKDDLTDFDVNQTDAQGRKTTRPSCKECRVHIDGHKFIPAESKRMDAIKPKNLFICPICRKTSIVDVTANLVKDHNHFDGTAREWICDSCNTGLGRFKDDVETLKRAIEYLEKFK